MRAPWRALQKLLPKGCHLGEQHNGHFYILDEHGNKLRSGSGLPIMVCGTPSDHRSRLNELARIRRALRDR